MTEDLLIGVDRVLERQVLHKQVTFRELVAANQRSVYALARHLTGNHHDAEDLSQDVFIRAHRALDSYRGDGQAMSWLYRITVNTFLTKRRRKALRWVQNPEAVETVPASDDVAPDRQVDAGFIRRQVELAMQALSPRERAAFILRFNHDYAVKDVADTMGLAEGTVKSLLYRSVQKLRRQLGPLVEEMP